MQPLAAIKPPTRDSRPALRATEPDAPAEALQACASLDELFRDPVRRYLPLSNALFWCYSPTTCGFAVWGRPGVAETRALLRVLDGYERLAPRFDLVQDGRGVEAIDPDALNELMQWLTRNASVLRERVRQRVAVLPPGVPGLALAGLQPVLDLDSPLVIETDAREAFRRLLPLHGDALFEEVEALVHRVRGVAPIVLEVRKLLAEMRGAIDLPEVARRLGLSSRSLQRQLQHAGVAFRSEQANARFRAAEELLRGDDKIAVVAAQLGLSQTGLNQLTYARAGLTPGELRRRLQASDRPRRAS